MNFVRLIRLPNLVIIALTQLIVLFIICNHIPFYLTQLNELWPPILAIILMTICTAAGGYVVNDIYDQKIDQINKKEGPIVGHGISIQSAWGIYFSFIFFGLLTGFTARFMTGHWIYFIGNFCGNVVLWLYAARLKGTPGFGNFLVSMLCAMTIMIMAWPLFVDLKNQTSASLQLTQTLAVLATFAFLVTFCRELVKDLEDIEGDQIEQARTLPVVYGIQKTKFILSILIAITFIVLALFLFDLAFGKNKMSVSDFILIAPLIMLLFGFFKLQNAQAKVDFSQISLLLKVIIIAGTIGFAFI